MEISELIQWATEGLDAKDAEVVKKAMEREVVKSKAAGLKAQSEFDAIIAERAALQEELAGNPTEKKVGTREYKNWYEKNAAKAIENDKKIQEFDTKHGEGSFAKALSGELPVGAPPVVAGTPLSEAQIQALVDAKVAGFKPTLPEADIQKMVDDRFNKQYAPTTANTVVSVANLMQKHMLAGRKTPIDFNKLATMANEKYAGNVDQAYDEWDKPEREKLAAADLEATIERRVNEEIQKRGAQAVPAGADATPGALSAHKTDSSAFDRNKLLQEMRMDLSKIQ